ncbi:MAG: hypothetical protein ACOYYI_01245 [Chloroflexota bacterium]
MFTKSNLIMIAKMLGAAMTMIFFIILASLATLILDPMKPANAAGVTVYPVQIELSKRAVVLNVENKGDTPVTLSVHKGAEWMVVAPPQISLAAGERGRVKVGRIVESQAEILRSTVTLKGADGSSTALPVIVPARH